MPEITEDRKCYMYRAVLKTDSTRDYIGVSIHPRERWWEHGYEAFKENSSRRFCKAIRKYGMDAFDWKIIAIYRNEQIARTMEELAVLCFGLGHYNETLWMGVGNGPVHFTPELRKKISTNTKAAMARPEVKEKLGTGGKAMWADPEMREYLTQNLVDMWKEPEYRQMIESRTREAMAAPEVRAKISAALTGRPGRPMPLELKLKIIAANTGKIVTEETKAKQSAAAIARNERDRANGGSMASKRWTKVKELGLRNLKELAEYELTHETKAEE